MRIDLNPSTTKIFAKNRETGEVTEISDWLYFFEEEGITGLGESSNHNGHKFDFWIEIEDGDRA